MFTNSFSPEQTSWLLLMTDDVPKAWETAEAAGKAIATAFWSNFRIYGLGPDFPYVETVAQRLLSVGRPVSALELLDLYRRKDPGAERAELLATCLEEIAHCDPKTVDMRGLRDHDLTEAFAYLERSSLPAERIAKLEWAYLEVFDHESTPPTLSRYLAQQPGFFADLISRVYRARFPGDAEDEAPNPGPEVEQDKATESF